MGNWEWKLLNPGKLYLNPGVQSRLYGSWFQEVGRGIRSTGAAINLIYNTVGSLWYPSMHCDRFLDGSLAQSAYTRAV